ncbi:hypothetical protein JCM18899A_37790 [Nocardioides sp. AN3]
MPGIGEECQRPRQQGDDDFADEEGDEEHERGREVAPVGGGGRPVAVARAVTVPVTWAVRLAATSVTSPALMAAVLGARLRGHGAILPDRPRPASDGGARVRDSGAERETGGDEPGAATAWLLR